VSGHTGNDAVAFQLGESMSDDETSNDMVSFKRSGTRTRTGAWRKSDPDLNFSDTRLRDLLNYWRDKRGDRLMPARGDIDVLEIKSHIGRLHITEFEHNPFRMRYRLIGTTSTNIVGRDMTGRYFDEIYPPDIFAGMRDLYWWIAENKRPLRGLGSAIFANKSIYNFETVNLPLSDDGETVNMAVGEIIYTLASGNDGTC
jgi:hypothetical protein